MDLRNMNFSRYTHDHMVLTLKRMYPGLVAGRDYRSAHPLGPDGEQNAPPFIAYWASDSVPQPADAEVEVFFHTNEESIRAEHVRLFRDMALRATDSKTIAPPDAPDPVKALAVGWSAYRDALRKVPEQKGFPFEVTWPVPPEEKPASK